MIETFTEYWLQLSTQVLDPKKRVYIGYLASAAFIAIVWQVSHGQKAKHAFLALFHRKIWTSRSAIADYGVFFINHAITLLLSPLLLARLSVAGATYHLLAQVAGAPGILTNTPPLLATVSFTLVLFLLDDWSRFALHKCMHDIPFLWALHKVHHSARTMTPLTVYRVHPLEGLLYALRSTIIQGLCTALFVYLMGNNLSLLSVLGASIFIFIFNVLGSNLRHSHIRISYWPALENFFISPFQHQLHHSTSPKHFNKNYGAVLAIWDKYSGSLQLSGDEAKPRFGLNRREQKGEHALQQIYWLPLTEAFKLLRRNLTRLLQSKND